VSLSQQQIKQVIDVIVDDRDRLIVELFHYTGIRRAELLSIKVSDIDFDNRMILIKGKGNKQRYVSFNEKLHKMLKKYSSRQGITSKLINIKERRLGYIFQELSGKVGYRIHPHRLRHAYANELYRKTKDVLLIKKLLGHSNIATTSRYLESLSALDDQDIESYRKVFG
jgi:site-specific recombinase XerD